MTKKILLVITGLGMGGAESQVSSLADQFAIRGYEVTLAYLLKPVVIRPSSKDIELVWLGGQRSAVAMVKAFFNLVRLINYKRPDVVHAHMFHANILVRIARIFVDVPRLVCTSHSTNEGGKLRMLMYRWTDRLADVFTNVSEEAINCFEAKKTAPIGRMYTVHNGIDVERFTFDALARTRVRKELNLLEKKVVIAIGRFHVAKDYPNLLAAFHQLAEVHDDIYLLIVGDGDLRNVIEQEIVSYQLSDKVLMLGNRRDIPELLSAADIFVLSSAWEGFGLVVAEAMSCERVTIATNCGGVSEGKSVV